MNGSMDRALADWLHEGPESGPREGLERALAATRRVGQRPGWSLAERWLPMRLTMARTRMQRPILALVMLALLIVVLVATALLVGSLRLQSAPPFRNGAVVYAESGDLFISDQFGGTPRALVAGPESDSNPVFSLQGDRVAFVRGGTKVMAVRPDGVDVTELATVPRGGLMRLAWSPDGRALLATSFGTGETWYQTDVVASDGSGSQKLGVGSHVIAAAWRPDGRKILFRGLLDGDDATRGVYVADADGSNVRKLPISPLRFFGGRLEWSPDGKHLAFESSGGPHGVGLSIADIDEDGAVTDVRFLDLDPDRTLEFDPVWSPDGSQLALLVAKDDVDRAGIIRVDGSGFRLVGPEGHWSVDLTWSPDGRSLVLGERDGNIVGPRGKVVSVDVATGEETEVRTPVDSWQRLAP